MRDVNEMLIFAGVVTHGGFTAAARALGLPKATVSRKIRDLEQRLGVRLLQRSTRRVALTEAGAAFQEHCARIAQEVEQAEAAVGQLHAAPRGTLRIAAGYTVGRLVLAPLLPDFLTRYPELRVHVRLSPAVRDPVTEAVDVVVTGRALRASSHVSRRLIATASHLYASPAYLNRRRDILGPSDLASHAALAMADAEMPERVDPWMLTGPARTETITPQAVLIANDPLPLLSAAVEGRGIVLLPDVMVSSHVAAGRLRPVLAGWRGPEVSVRVLYASRRGLPPKVRVFIDFLAHWTDRMGPTLADDQRPAAPEGSAVARRRAKTRERNAFLTD